MTDRRRRPAAVFAVGLLTVAALIAFAPTAAAHVAVDLATPNGDGTTTVTLAWDHPCTPETATTGLTITAGEGVEFTGAATDLTGWTATVEPGTASLRGPGVPTGRRAAVMVTARITAPPGATVTFPTVQQCGDQRAAWTDPDPAAQYPAPTLIVTGAITAPATAGPTPSSGADTSQVLIGILLLMAALATFGVVAAGDRSRG